MRKVVFCKNCGFLGSVEDGTKTAKCINCDNERLYITDIELDKWLNISEDEKNTLKENWKNEVEKMDEQVKVNTPKEEQSKQEFYLLQIAENTRKTKNWVTFWSILGIIGIVVTIAFYFGVLELIKNYL